MIDYSKISFVDILRKLQISDVKEFMITDSVQHRPDLISYKIYNDVDYQPFLIIFNYINNIYTQLNTGDIIYYPEQQDIETFIYNEKVKYL